MNALVERSQNRCLRLLENLQQLLNLPIIGLVLLPARSDAPDDACAATPTETNLKLVFVLLGSCVDLVVEEHDADALGG